MGVGFYRVFLNKVVVFPFSVGRALFVTFLALGVVAIDAVGDSTAPFYSVTFGEVT